MLFNIKELLSLANLNMVKNMAKPTATSNNYTASGLWYCVPSSDIGYNQQVITASKKKKKIVLTIDLMGDTYCYLQTSSTVLNLETGLIYQSSQHFYHSNL